MNVVAEGRHLPNLRELIQIGYTFVLTLIAWVFFRSETLADAFGYIGRMITTIHVPITKYNNFYESMITVIILFIFLIVEWFGRKDEHPLNIFQKNGFRNYRWIIYLIIILIIVFWPGEKQEFIYFQF